MDGVAVISNVLSFDLRVVAVDSHRSVIMRDRKGENFPVQLHFTTNESEELYNSSHCKGHAMSIVSVCDIKCGGAALHFARQEREVHIVRGHEEGLVVSEEVANKR